jgi:S1-C subfamily serine protease
MKKAIALFLVATLLTVISPGPARSTEPIAKTALQAAGLLYATDGQEKHFLCSTFTFEHNGNKYELGTASHCVSGPDLPNNLQFSVKFDESSKTEYPAKVVAVGGENSEAGDVAVLEIETTDQLVVTPLSDEQVEVGDQVLYAGSPEALGKQLYYGLVSATKVNVPKTEGGQGAPQGWNNTMLVEMAGGPGASGSGVLSAKTGKVVGVLVGHPPDGVGIIIVVRIEQLKALWSETQSPSLKQLRRVLKQLEREKDLLF